MSVSKFHMKVRAILDEILPDDWEADGWPMGEVNLCHLAGMRGARFADFYVHDEQGRAFVVEVHSSLHNEDGIGAWKGTMSDHYRRQGNDENKRHICSRLGIELIELWPDMSIEDINEKVLHSIKDSCQADTKSKDIENPKPKAFESRPFSGTTKSFEAGRKLEGSGSFKKGAGKLGSRGFGR